MESAEESYELHISGVGLAESLNVFGLDWGPGVLENDKEGATVVGVSVPHYQLPWKELTPVVVSAKGNLCMYIDTYRFTYMVRITESRN